LKTPERHQQQLVVSWLVLLWSRRLHPELPKYQHRQDSAQGVLQTQVLLPKRHQQASSMAARSRQQSLLLQLVEQQVLLLRPPKKLQLDHRDAPCCLQQLPRCHQGSRHHPSPLCQGQGRRQRMQGMHPMAVLPLLQLLPGAQSRQQTKAQLAVNQLAAKPLLMLLLVTRPQQLQRTSLQQAKLKQP
jgi:hypothetical protein